MTKFIVNNRTDALKTDINLFFTITNCRIACSRSLTRHMNFKIYVYVRIWTIKISQWARVNFCSYRKNFVFGIDMIYSVCVFSNTFTCYFAYLFFCFSVSNAFRFLGHFKTSFNDKTSNFDRFDVLFSYCLRTSEQTILNLSIYI